MSLHLDASEPVTERRPIRFFGSPDTDVGLLLSAVLGLALTLVAFAFLWQTRQSPVSAMFFQRSPIISWVPPLEVYVASWGLAILILKFRLRRKQEKFLDSPVLSELPESIFPDAAGSYLQRMEVSEPKWSESLLFHRIAKLLAHFEVTQDRSEIASLSTSQSDIDGTTLRSSYTMVKVFIWAIPILGFIGTVIGLQEAIRGFAGLSNVDRLQEQLAPITSGLGGAFQATLIALALSLLLMFPSSASERAEWRFLNKIDDFCNDQILRRLYLQSTQTVAEPIDWSELKSLGKTIATDFATSLSEVIPRMAEALYSELISTGRVELLVNSLSRLILENSGKALEEALASQVAELKALGTTIQADTKQRSDAAEVQSDFLRTMTDAHSSLRETVVALHSATSGIGRIVTQVDAVGTSFAASVTQTIPRMAEVLYLELTSKERLEQLINPLVHQILDNSGKTIEEALASQIAELKALDKTIQADTKQRVEDVDIQSRVLQTMTDAQTSLRETLVALHSATSGIGRVVAQVDARRELDSVQKALERVSQMLHNGAPATSVLNVASDGAIAE